MSLCVLGTLCNCPVRQLLLHFNYNAVCLIIVAAPASLGVVLLLQLIQATHRNLNHIAI